MPITRSAVVAVGGALGATVRWGAGELIGPTGWPWALLIVNVVGSFLLGAALVGGSTPGREIVRLGAGVGFCGGLTTFSGFALASVRLLDDGRAAAATVFVIVSLVLGASALVAGMRTRHREVRP